MSGSESPDVVGMDVGSVHRTGGTITGRSTGAAAAAKGLKEGLDAAHATLGHPAVRAALRDFVTTDITDHANHLGQNVTAAGHHVSNVASTARGSDDTEAAGLTVDLTAAETGYRTIESRTEER